MVFTNNQKCILSTFFHSLFKPTKISKTIRGCTIIADRAIKENRVVLCGAAKCFVVIGESGEKYTVSVHPVLHCSCPAKKNCWHIKAVLRCIGYDDAVCTGVLSFSELFRKRRARKGIGSSGRKAPRIGDVDTVVLSAPDASNKQKVTRSNRALLNRGILQANCQINPVRTALLHEGTNVCAAKVDRNSNLKISNLTIKKLLNTMEQLVCGNVKDRRYFQQLQIIATSTLAAINTDLNFTPRQQQDASEFFNEAVAPIVDSLTAGALKFTLKNETYCAPCGERFLNEEQYVLNLPLANDTQLVFLRDVLLQAGSSKPMELCGLCDACRSELYNSSTMCHWPEILNIRLVRENNDGTVKKIPIMLEEMITLPWAKYSLASLVVYLGHEIHSGHYQAYGFCPTSSGGDGAGYKFDDSCVTRSDCESLLRSRQIQENTTIITLLKVCTDDVDLM